MVNSQETIERSIYVALLNMAIRLGYTINPEDYLPTSEANAKRFQEDLKKIADDKGFYVGIFGVGNNHSRGIKETPRIVVDSEGFYPGDIGLPKQVIGKEEGIGYTATEGAYETISQYMNIRLCAHSAEHMRLLHQIMFWAVPQRGYLKPYDEPKFLFTGNIFLRVVNFYNMSDLDNGLMEKVYQFEVQDCFLERNTPPEVITPIKDISVLLENADYTLKVPKEPDPPSTTYQ